MKLCSKNYRSIREPWVAGLNGCAAERARSSTSAALLAVEKCAEIRAFGGFSAPERGWRIPLFSILLRRGNVLNSTLLRPKKLLPSRLA
jgi:hypothetical protein